jgi:L-fuconolactonase
VSCRQGYSVVESKVSFSHHILFNAFKRFSQGYSAAERAALFHDTAVQVYRIRDV